MNRIVQFKNGKYGIRKRNLIQTVFNFGGVFKDFNPAIIHWRKPQESFFIDCQKDTIEEVEDWLLRVNNDYVK